MNDKVLVLPEDFIGKEDEAKLESFGAFLITHGAATRWRWQRTRGIDVRFLIFRGGADEQLAAAIRREARDDAFLAVDERGRRLSAGPLEAVMAAVDSYLRSQGPGTSA